MQAAFARLEARYVSTFGAPPPLTPVALPAGASTDDGADESGSEEDEAAASPVVDPDASPADKACVGSSQAQNGMLGSHAPAAPRTR